MLLLKLLIQCCLGTFVRMSVSETYRNCQMHPLSNVDIGKEGFRHCWTFCQALYSNNFHSHPPNSKKSTHTLILILWILNRFILIIWHYWLWPFTPNNKTRKKQRKDSMKFQLYEEPFVYILAATNTVNPSCWVTDLKVSKHTKHWSLTQWCHALGCLSRFHFLMTCRHTAGRQYRVWGSGSLHQCQTSQLNLRREGL